MVKEAIVDDLTQFAAEQQRRFDAATSPGERKKRAHFGTPSAIAEFMAETFSVIPQGKVRILDAGASVGTLSAAVCQRVVRLTAPRYLEIELWETDLKLVPHLRETMDQCRKQLLRLGHRLDYTICIDDFIVANTQKSLFGDGPVPSFHLTILNPPYFKVRKESTQAKVMDHIVHGQPNIYAFFMAVAADLLLPHGEMVAITPRSYFNGSYFKRFRQWFFDRMSARHIHIFESRTEAFNDDEVLQENVILHAEKAGNRKDIVLTTSVGRDLHDVAKWSSPYGKIIDNSHGDCIVRVATNPIDHEIVAAFDALPHRFRSLGFEVSTGPVVTFRSIEYLRRKPSRSTAPLLWMHNVRPFITRFPEKNGKPTHIEVTEGSMRLLVPAKRYVLLKRFTAKEERRRLVAGIMEKTDSYSEWVGLENHLNYIYLQGAELTTAQAFGLAAFFNSRLVDRYFRAISGSTQVNATEIRSIPVPDERALTQIGEKVEHASDRNAQMIDGIVGRALRLPGRLVEQVCGAAP